MKKPEELRFKRPTTDDYALAFTGAVSNDSGKAVVLYGKMRLDGWHPDSQTLAMNLYTSSECRKLSRWLLQVADWMENKDSKK